MESNLKQTVQAKYAAAAERVRAGSSGDCSGAPACGCDPVSGNLYDPGETAGLPREAALASLGCGNPGALARLRPGEVVLDLGSGGGLDALLAARQVGPAGKVFGLDMTDEMLVLARDNQRKAELDNVEFLRGDIETIPLPDRSVDVIISNCVVNLAADKQKVVREAFRVLRPGGRLAVADVVVRGAMPAVVRRSLELWVGCVAGALDEDTFRALLRATGFVDVTIEATRVYSLGDAAAVLAGAGLDPAAVARDVAGRLLAAFVRARRPL